MTHRFPSTIMYFEWSIRGLWYRWMRTPAFRSMP